MTLWCRALLFVPLLGLGTHEARAQCSLEFTTSCKSDVLEVQSGFTMRGHELPGTIVKGNFFDDRLSLTIRDLQGADLFSKDRVNLSNHLTKGDSWRRNTAVNLGLLRSSIGNVDVSAGVSDMRIPYTVGQSMQIGEFSQWEKNLVTDTNIDVQLLDGRVNYQGTYMYSEYRRERNEAEFFAEHDKADLLAGDGTASNGSAHWHRGDVLLLKQDNMSASVSLMYRDIDPDFTSLLSKRATVYGSDGKKTTIGGGSELTSKRKSAREIADTFRTGTYWRPGTREAAGTFSEVGGNFKIQNFQVVGHWNSKQDRYESYRDQEEQTSKLLVRYKGSPVIASAWSQQRNQQAEVVDTFGGRLGVSISELVDESGIELSGVVAQLIPDQIGGYGLREVKSDSMDASRSRQDFGYGLDLDWEWDTGVVNTSFSQRESSPSGLLQDFAGSRDTSLDLTLTTFGDTWDFTAYVSANHLVSDLTSGQSRDFYLGGGGSVWLKPERWPTFMLALDYNNFESREIGASSKYADADLKFAIDFSKYLETIDFGLVHARFMYHAQHISEADGTETTSSLEHAVIVSFASKL